MATVASRFSLEERQPDVLSGTPRALALDRWIFVITAAWFIVIILTGFIPDSIMKVGLVQAGQRPPFPLVLHMHAVLMGSFLLLVLAQTLLMATGRNAYHVQLGVAAFLLAPALVIVGFILVPTIYYETWDAFQAAPPGARAELQKAVSFRENVMLLQLRVGLLFPLFLTIGLRARQGNAGLHKRMMLLAPAMALGAGFARITWLPTTMPASALALDLYILVAVAPMFLWDLMRNRWVHEAYWIWLSVNLPFAVVVLNLWDTPLWHETAKRIMGV